MQFCCSVEWNVSDVPPLSSPHSTGSTPGTRCRSWRASPPADSARSPRQSSRWRPAGRARCGATWCKTAASPGWRRPWARWTAWGSGPDSRWYSEKMGREEPLDWWRITSWKVGFSMNSPNNCSLCLTSDGWCGSVSVNQSCSRWAGDTFAGLWMF